MSDLFGNHIVGFPTRRLIFYDMEKMINNTMSRHVSFDIESGIHFKISCSQWGFDGFLIPGIIILNLFIQFILIMSFMLHDFVATRI